MIEHFSIFQPNAWDNSVAPINIIHKLINDLNKLVDEVNNIEDTSFERAKAYTDSQLDPIRTDLGNIAESLRTISRTLGSLTSDIATLDARESSHYAETVTRLNNLSNYIQSVRAELKNYTDLSIIMLRNQIEEEIEELRQLINSMLDLKTIDGLTGQYATVREILSTRIVSKIKRTASNRFALRWSDFKPDANHWFFAKTSRFKSNCNILAPTWRNLKLNNYEFTTGMKKNLYHQVLNTWGAFSSATLLFLADLVHNINRFYNTGTAEIANNFKNVDLYDYAQFSAWIGGGDTVPDTITQIDVSTNYDGSNTYVSLLTEQFKKSITFFTGYGSVYWLYGSSGLFSGTADLPMLFQLLAGLTNDSYYSNFFNYDV